MEIRQKIAKVLMTNRSSFELENRAHLARFLYIF